MARRTLCSIVKQPESTLHETRRYDSAGTTFDECSLGSCEGRLGTPNACQSGTARGLRAGFGQGRLEVRHGPWYVAQGEFGLIFSRYLTRFVGVDLRAPFVQDELEPGPAIERWSEQTRSVR